MEENFYIEMHCQQKNHAGERICGDVFLSERIKQEQRIIAVLSDGMGHGVKANVLATLTATMVLGFTRHRKDTTSISYIITKTLPVCSTRKISYSTFSTVDIAYNGQVAIVEYDNPSCFLIRDGEVLDLAWQEYNTTGQQDRKMIIRSTSFKMKKEDRIVLCSDGITQSGLGSKNFEGWSRESITSFVKEIIFKSPEISAVELATKVVSKAMVNDNYMPKDDLSCVVVYLRQPRRLVLCSGPPYEKTSDAMFASKVATFEGKKIICGGTTADIIARELNREIIDSNEFVDPELPQTSTIEGIDLITEGMLTLNKVTRLLKKYNSETVLGKGPADRIVSMLLVSDEINILIGTKINEAHQDPTLPVELDIRRNVLKGIANLLENKFLKEVILDYI